MFQIIFSDAFYIFSYAIEIAKEHIQYLDAVFLVEELLDSDRDGVVGCWEGLNIAHLFSIISDLRIIDKTIENAFTSQ